MKDDIRPSGSAKPKLVDNTQIQEPELKLYESPNAGDRLSAPRQDEYNDRYSNQEENSQSGFVITPDGKEIKNPFSKLARKFNSLSKKKKLLVIFISLAVLVGIGFGAYKLLSKPAPVKSEPAPVVQKQEEPPKPTTEASALTGVQVAIGANQRPITSVQIENSPDARPQSGLLDAGVVFEAIAEGGITRFNASFQEAKPDFIGPIRSVRPYYAQLVAPFDPVFVHAGGSAEGLATLSALGLKDLDHGANGGAFQRISERYAPHNLFSNTSALDAVIASRGYAAGTPKGFLRKSEKPGQPIAARTIDLQISSPLYNVHYDYDQASNSYKRSMAGKPHNDWRSGAQLSPKVVVAMTVPWSQNGIYSVYGIIGSGSGVVFQDGQATPVTWTKSSDKEQISFTGPDGQPLGLNPGQTWVTLVKSASDIVSAP